MASFEDESMDIAEGESMDVVKPSFPPVSAVEANVRNL